MYNLFRRVHTLLPGRWMRSKCRKHIPSLSYLWAWVGIVSSTPFRNLQNFNLSSQRQGSPRKCYVPTTAAPSGRTTFPLFYCNQVILSLFHSSYQALQNPKWRPFTPEVWTVSVLTATSSSFCFSWASVWRVHHVHRVTSDASKIKKATIDSNHTSRLPNPRFSCQGSARPLGIAGRPNSSPQNPTTELAELTETHHQKTRSPSFGKPADWSNAETVCTTSPALASWCQSDKVRLRCFAALDALFSLKKPTKTHGFVLRSQLAVGEVYSSRRQSRWQRTGAQKRTCFHPQATRQRKYFATNVLSPLKEHR